MRNRLYWGDNSRRVVIRKVVVTSNGRLVAKNYVKADLHRGDLGIHLRLDRTQVEQMTDAQRLTAANAFALMVEDLAAVLGVRVAFATDASESEE